MTSLMVGVLIGCPGVAMTYPDPLSASDWFVARSYSRKVRRPLLVAYAPNEGAMDRLTSLFYDRSVRMRYSAFVPIMIDASVPWRRVATSSPQPTQLAFVVVNADGRTLARLCGSTSVPTMCSFLDRVRTAIDMGKPYADIGGPAIRFATMVDEARFRNDLPAAVRHADEGYRLASTVSERFECGVRLISSLAASGKSDEARDFAAELSAIDDFDADQAVAVRGWLKRLAGPHLQPTVVGTPVRYSNGK